MDINPKETVLSLAWVNGQLVQIKKDENGNIKHEMIPGLEKKQIKTEFDTDDFTDRFKNTETIPNDALEVKTSPIIKKTVAKNVGSFKTQDDLMKQYLDTIFRLHALLIRVVGSPETLADRTEPLEIKNTDTGLRDMVLLLMDSLGEPWKSVRNKIK